jgi:hypothetical protein
VEAGVIGVADAGGAGGGGAGDSGDGASAEASDSAARPLAILGPGRPNPFLHATEIGFALREATPVQLSVYDVTGRQVAALLDAPLDAGEHAVSWSPSDTPPGVYFLRLRAGATSVVRKVTLVE